jgi:hypothetical protein
MIQPRILQWTFPVHTKAFHSLSINLIKQILFVIFAADPTVPHKPVQNFHPNIHLIQSIRMITSNVSMIDSINLIPVGNLAMLAIALMVDFAHDLLLDLLMIALSNLLPPALRSLTSLSPLPILLSPSTPINEINPYGFLPHSTHPQACITGMMIL